MGSFSYEKGKWTDFFIADPNQVSPIWDELALANGNSSCQMIWRGGQTFWHPFNGGPTFFLIKLVRPVDRDVGQNEPSGIELTREKVRANIMEDMEQKPAINKAAVEAMIEICKKYNIALYKGQMGRAAKKLAWMSKSEQILKRRLQRVEEGKFGCGLKEFYELLEPFAEEALEEKAKQEKAQAKH